MNNKRSKVIENILSLSEKISENLKQRGQVIDNVSYYKDFQFKGSSLGVNDIVIVKLKDNELDKTPKARENEESKEKILYEIYDVDNNLIASVNETGNIEFESEYIKELEEQYGEYFDSLALEEAEFELPRERDKSDLLLTKKEIDEQLVNRKLDSVSKVLGDRNINSYSEMKTDQTPQFEELTNKQELDADVRVTQTENLSDLIPELKEKGIVKVGIVYTDDLEGQNAKEQDLDKGQR